MSCCPETCTCKNSYDICYNFKPYLLVNYVVNGNLGLQKLYCKKNGIDDIQLMCESHHVLILLAPLYKIKNKSQLKYLHHEI